MPDIHSDDWIGRAKQAATRQKRLDQMLDELREGFRLSLHMEHKPSRKT